MLAEIRSRLEEGVIKNVGVWGLDNSLAPPYVIFRIEGSELCVWAHYEPDYILWLEVLDNRFAHTIK